MTAGPEGTSGAGEELKETMLTFECNCGIVHEVRPWLFTEVQEALSAARQEGFREALESEAVKSILDFSVHSGFCGQGQTGMGQCECGFKEALSKFDALRKEAGRKGDK